MLTLAIGDLFIPERAVALPDKFRKLLAPNPNSTPSNGKIAQVLCLGNITSLQATLEFLYRLLPKFHIVKGEYDNEDILAQQLKNLGASPEIPYYKVLSHDNLRIGVTSGYQVVPKHDDMALLSLARDLDVDILVWGGGLHRVEAYAVEGKFFVNPGSATGSSSWNEEDREEEKKEEKEEMEEKKEKEEKEEKVEKEKTEEDEKERFEEIFAQIAREAKVTPSFCLMETHGLTCVLYIYTYVDGEVKVDKVMYKKE